MIKITKDLTAIPSSLENAITQANRQACITHAKWLQKHEASYKQNDTKNALREIYHGKCAFCEQKLIPCTGGKQEECSQTIEHYRPKGKYYWLAFSWDNLLLCCHGCNNHKGDSFPIRGTRAVYDPSDPIHASSARYQAHERPDLIHPEAESVLGKLTFEHGVIHSDDPRIEQTIRICDLNRSSLIEKRKTLIDRYQNRLNDLRLRQHPISSLKEEIFKEFQDPTCEFRAVRYWCITTTWQSRG